MEVFLQKGAPNNPIRSHCEYRMARQDGEVIWVDVASSETYYEGRRAILLTINDISGRKAAEEEHRKLTELARKQEEQLVHSSRLAEMGEMAASVAHELNQPLTGIRNFAKNTIYMIENDVGTKEEIKDTLQLISKQVDRAAKIINQMRALTRRSERKFTQLEINVMLNEIIEFLSPQFRLSQVQVELRLEESLPPVMGDRIRLEQVFLNLMTNARQAMEDTEERIITICTSYNEQDSLPICIEISDTGRGFSEEQAEKIFMPFYTTKEVGQGTGLGLPISLSIIQEHKGRITAESKGKCGALFTIGLPSGKLVTDHNEEAG